MTIVEALHAAGYKRKFRRKSWNHDDAIYVLGHKDAVGGGELFWSRSGTKATLSYARDLVGEDWELTND